MNSNVIERSRMAFFYSHALKRSKSYFLPTSTNRSDAFDHNGYGWVEDNDIQLYRSSEFHNQLELIVSKHQFHPKNSQKTHHNH